MHETTWHGKSLNTGKAPLRVEQHQKQTPCLQLSTLLHAQSRVAVLSACSLDHRGREGERQGHFSMCLQCVGSAWEAVRQGELKGSSTLSGYWLACLGVMDPQCLRELSRVIVCSSQLGSQQFGFKAFFLWELSLVFTLRLAYRNEILLWFFLAAVL